MAIRLDAADNRVVVLRDEGAFADVIGPALGAEDEEAVEPHPVIDLPGVASGGIRDLGRTGNRLRLPRRAAGEQFGVVVGHGFLIGWR